MSGARIRPMVIHVLYDRDVIGRPGDPMPRVLDVFTDEQTALNALLRQREIAPRSQLMTYRSRSGESLNLGSLRVMGAKPSGEGRGK